MKKVGLISFLLSISSLLGNIFYTFESEGYFKNPHFLQNKMVCSDNYDSAIYCIEDGLAEKIVSAPGIGRYYTVNDDKTKIGCKLIDEKTGLQTPIIYDMIQKKITYLAEKQKRCSQVYFKQDTLFFMLENVLHIMNGNNYQTFDLPSFSNLMAISPDAKIIALRNENEQIFLFSVQQNADTIITQPGLSFIPVSWSHDGNYLLVQDIGEGLYVYHISDNKLTDLKMTGFAAWFDSTNLLVAKKELKNHILQTSFIKYNISSSEVENIEHLADFTIPDFSVEADKIVFTSLLDKSLYQAILSDNSIVSLEKIIHLPDPLTDIQFLMNMGPVTKNLTIPYINQMYDTPQGYAHNYGACAAATATMAMMYYKILPHWNTTNSNPYYHISHWGNYIGGTVYHYRGITYNHTVYYSSGAGYCSNGIDNYHWFEGSPNSKMRGLLQNHGITSYQHWTSSCTYSLISGHLINHYPYPLCVTMTASGHLILAKGLYDHSRKLLFYHDPYGNKNTSPYLGYDGNDVIYDWPGENNGYASLVSVAWSVSAQAAHQPAPELEIDVLQLAYKSSYEDYNVENEGFYLSTTGTLGMRYWRSEIGGHNELYWWTGAIGGTIDDYFAVWRPNIIHSGIYRIEVFIPNESAVTTNAMYKIYHSEGTDVVSVNQSSNGGQWVNLGEYLFSHDNCCYVYLGDAVGAKSSRINKHELERLDKILYDAARFTLLESDNPFIYFSDFEYNSGGMTTNLDWVWGVDDVSGANSGSKVWGTILNGNYHNRSNIYLDLSIHTGQNSMLSFYQWYQIEDVYRSIVFDGGNVKISTDGGTNFELLYPENGYPHTMRYSIHNPLSNEPCFSGESEGWELVNCSLAMYPAQNIILRWHFGSDGATVDRGWYIDNVKVEELPLYLEAPNLQISSVGSLLQITWDEIENALFYHIYFNSEPMGTYTILDCTNNTFYDIEMNENKGFYYVIASNNPIANFKINRHHQSVQQK